MKYKTYKCEVCGEPMAIRKKSIDYLLRCNEFEKVKEELHLLNKEPKCYLKRTNHIDDFIVDMVCIVADCDSCGKTNYLEYVRIEIDEIKF